ncbi:MAG: sulfur carrier protein ThiS adenylyltransferase ThiF [Coriobacteriia bacterium]|nr:sulfur carrier protein ThiS adenylyltransferase ThiF [Coriobacteriia bacterium]
MPYPTHPVPAPDEYAALRARLGSSRVGVIGLGGLGSNVAWMLARAGVGTLVLADHDVVDASNLERQFYFADQVGREKTAALTDNLRRITAELRLECFQAHIDQSNIGSIFGGVDVLVEAVDSARDKALIVAAASEQLPGVPIVAASGIAGYGSPNDIITRHLMGDVWMVGDLVSEVSAEHPLFASRVAIAAGHQAHMTVRLLLGYPQA